MMERYSTGDPFFISGGVQHSCYCRTKRLLHFVQMPDNVQALPSSSVIIEVMRIAR